MDRQIPGHFYLLWKGFSYSQLAFIQVLIFPRQGKKLETESIASGIKRMCNGALLESQLSHKLPQLFKKDAEQDEMRQNKTKKRERETGSVGKMNKIAPYNSSGVVFVFVS